MKAIRIKQRTQWKNKAVNVSWLMFSNWELSTPRQDRASQKCIFSYLYKENNGLKLNKDEHI